MTGDILIQKLYEIDSTFAPYSPLVSLQREFCGGMHARGTPFSCHVAIVINDEGQVWYSLLPRIYCPGCRARKRFDSKPSNPSNYSQPPLACLQMRRWRSSEGRWNVGTRVRRKKQRPGYKILFGELLQYVS